MPALLTAADRAIHGLRIEIDRQQRWLADAVEERDRRGIEFHRAKLAELRKELVALQENQP